MKHAFLTLLIAIGVGSAYWLGRQQAAPPAKPPAITQSAYVCPMHSHIVQDHPGACPICGMDLVATQDAGGGSTQIHVDTATQQKLGVRLAMATRSTLSHDIQTHATLVPDERTLLRITPNVSGMLDKLHISYVGQQIAHGQVLYEISSTAAQELQNEYIDTLRRGEPTQRMIDTQRARNRQALQEAQDETARKQAEEAARQSEEQMRSILQPIQRDRERLELRLRQIGFTEAMLARLLESQKALPIIPVRATQACTVLEIMARPGMALEPMTEILRCADTSRNWLNVTLYPDQFEWVREGDAVRIKLENGAVINTRLSGLSPIVDSTTRTAHARLPIQGKAPLGSYAAVTIHTTPRQVLNVPKSAVIRSGRGSFVIRALDKGHFMPVPVITGIESAEHIAIRDGLEEGDTVVVNGQFLLDAAASIADVAQRLQNRQDGLK